MLESLGELVFVFLFALAFAVVVLTLLKHKK